MGGRLLLAQQLLKLRRGLRLQEEQMRLPPADAEALRIAREQPQALLLSGPRLRLRTESPVRIDGGVMADGEVDRRRFGWMIVADLFRGDGVGVVAVDGQHDRPSGDGHAPLPLRLLPPPP